MTSSEFKTWLHSTTPRRSLVMGILNITPDSFSDGDRYSNPDAAIAHAREMAAAGADMIDIGGESTRPGSQRTPADEQIRRVVPVLKGLAALHPAFDTMISIDTTRAAVAAAALDAGAAVINDISGGTDDPAILPLAAERKTPIILMHMQGQPATMQVAPKYDDVVADIMTALQSHMDAAIAAGVDPRDILLDPGIGFGKTAEHSLELLRRLGEFCTLGRPLVVGTSRKGFLGRIAGEEKPDARPFSTAASVAWCLSHGADIVRVHDVDAAIKVLHVTRAIAGESSACLKQFIRP